MEFALQILMSMLIGVFGGVAVDQWLHTTPWLTMLGLFGGIGLGMGSVYKRVMQAQQQAKQHETNTHDR